MPSAVKYRNMRLEDIPAIIKLEAECFPGIPPERYWETGMLRAHIEKFPEGQFVTELDGHIVGSATNLRVSLEAALKPHTWRSIAGRGYLGTHEPFGEVLYGTEVMVHPDARRRGVARGFYRLRKELLKRENMRAFVAGGRIPGFQKYESRLTVHDYVARVVSGELTDRTLTPQLRSGMTVACVMPLYITDPNSLGWATMLVWWNLDYEAPMPSVPSGSPSATGVR